MIELPVFQNISAKFNYSIQIEKKIYRLSFDWNVRSENWYLSIEHMESGYKLTDIKIIPNFPLLKQRKAMFSVLDGDLFLIKVNNIGDLLDYDNFGIDYKLYYYTKTEYEDWLNSYGLD